MHRLNVEIDQAICIGSGDCVRIAPVAFDLDDDGLAVLLDPASTSSEALRLAASSCPSGAIRIAEAEAMG